MSTKPDKNSESNIKNKKSKSEIKNKKSESEYKNKKSKEKPIIKLQVFAEEGIKKDVTSWDNMFVINFLQNIDSNKYWKGKFVMYRNYIIIKGNNTSFKKKFDIKTVVGYIESPFNKKIITIGILEEEHMLYLFLRCNDIKDKDKIIMEFDSLRKKNEDIYQEIEAKKIPDESLYTNNIENKVEEEYANLTENHDDPEVGTSKMSENSIIPKRSQRQPIEKEEIYIPSKKATYETKTPPLVMKTMPAIIMNTELSDNTFDGFEIDSRNLNSENVMWIENTKYIDYSPSLGMNIQSDDGPIYIYCAHQVGPRIDEFYSDDSDSA